MKEMRSKPRIIQAIIFLFFGSVIVIISILLGRNIHSTFQNAKWVSHSKEVSARAEKAISLLKDVETGHRGYVISKDSMFLEPYFRSKNLIISQIDTLKSLAVDNPSQKSRIDTLKLLAKRRLIIINKSLRHLQKAGVNEIIIDYLRLGKSVMDSSRQIITRIKVAEQRLLLVRSLDLENSTIQTQYLMLVLLITLLFSIPLGYFVLWQMQTKGEKDEKRINELNQELAQHIEELRSSNEEIHSINEELAASNKELSSTNEELFSKNGLFHHANDELEQAQAQILRLNSNLELKLTHILENNLDLVCYANEKAQVQYLNKAGRKLLGIEVDTHFTSIFSPNFILKDDWENKVPTIQQFIKEHGFWHGELNLVNKSGKSIPMWFQVAAEKNEITGEKFHSIIGRDLSSEREVKESLIQNENKYKLLFENSPQSMWIYDFETKNIIEANRAATIKYGYTKEEFVGLNIEKLRPESEIEKLNALFSTLSPFGYAQSADIIHLSKYGEQFNVEIYSFGFLLNGKIVRLILTNDVTEKNKFEENLKKINEELIFQNEQLDHYVYIVSHNIRGPIASLLGLVNMLKRNEWPESIEPILQNIYKVTERLDDVVIDLNKILSTKNNLNAAREKVNIRHLITDIFEMINNQIEISHAKFELDIEILELNVVKSYLHSIFLNLISNAIKYKENSRSLVIKIAAKQMNSDATIIVSDNGMGIDMAKFGDKIFGLYKRFHLHIEGKGLGLHLVKTQVESLGGRISVESKVNVGTTFTIKLPLISS